MSSLTTTPVEAAGSRKVLQRGTRRYSGFSLLYNALTGNRKWPRLWRTPDPRPSYDVVIIGGGLHGLATAYYLARNHGITNVAVVERGWIGSGNAGRNTTIVRSNYFLDANARFFEHSLKLWEGLSQELNYNVMFSQRGVINLFHSPRERESWLTRYNAIRLNGIDAATLTLDELSARVPALDCSPDARMPVLGAVIQPRGGVARHDAVVWGYARAADSFGVDILQGCEVTGILRKNGCVVAVETSRGRIGAGKVAISVAGHSSTVARMAGIRLPIESHLLQAVVSEPVKPFLDSVVSSPALHAYVSQTDKGEVLIGGPLDGYNSYSQRGSLPTVEHILGAASEMFPALRHLRWMRQWISRPSNCMWRAAMAPHSAAGSRTPRGFCSEAVRPVPRGPDPRRGLRREGLQTGSVGCRIQAQNA